MLTKALLGTAAVRTNSGPGKCRAWEREHPYAFTPGSGRPDCAEKHPAWEYSRAEQEARSLTA